MSKKEKYRKLFRQEAGRLLGNIAGYLLDLENDPTLLGQLSHDLHTLKGSSRLVGLTEIGDMAHALEDFSGPGTACASGDADAVDLALEAVDMIEGLAGLGKPEPSPEDLARMLGVLHGGDSADSSAAVESPAPAPPPEPKAPVESAEDPQPLAVSAEVDAAREPLLVTVEELDRLMNLSGELLIQQHRMAARFDQGREILKLVDRLRPRMQEDAVEPLRSAVRAFTHELENDMVEAGFLFSEVRERTASVRMQPFSTLSDPLLRQARADARRIGKTVQVKVRGGHLPLDRGILEYLRPVLLHTVTNSVAHGIEPPERRLELGKPEEGNIRIQVKVDGNRILVLVEDDGAGLDPGLLRQAAVRKGLVTEADADEMEDADALHLIFSPGFSTAKVVSNLSGRGVGMDAVRANVERLRGQITVESERDHYTRITLALPASIGVVQGLLIEVSGETLAIPIESVANTRHQRKGDTTPAPDAPHLATILGWEKQEAPAAGRWWIELKDGADRALFEVDRVLSEAELVLKHPGRLLSEHRLLAGATILPNGDVGLVLSTTQVLRHAQLDGKLASRRAARSWGEILIADDSPVARHLLREALEEAGWKVREAADGREGVNQLEKGGIVGVVTDFEMPRLDGLGLLEAVRAWDDTLPTLLLTSRADEIRKQALDSGAARVVVKGHGAFELIVGELDELVVPPGEGDPGSGTVAPQATQGD